MRLIVCDAGPIIHLHEAGLLSLLKNCGRLHVPLLVYQEVCAHIDVQQAWPDWIQVDPLEKDIQQAELWRRMGDLHGGESEAFVLSKSIKADWFLTDDAAARLFASTLGMEVHGSFGVVLWNVAHQYLDRKQGFQALAMLKQTSLWISEAIMEEAKQAVIEIASV